MGGLVTYTLYYKPTDFPDNYVIREFKDGKPTDKHWIFNTRDEAFERMRETYAVFIARSEKDEKHIIGTWI